FEGVIEQVYTNPETQSQMTFMWFIDGDDVRLDILSGEESMSIIPNFSSLSLNLFGDKADAEGNYWYSNTPLSEIAVNAPSLRLLESTESIYENKPAKEVKVMGDSGMMVVQYLDYINVNMKNMLAVFAESAEFKAVSLANDSGFPVSSVLMTSKDAIYTLTTKSIQEKVVDNKTFQVPANYKLFTGIK
ncbi:MAG: hypothetical protein ACI9O4_001634, partial [Chitinophagales bacterium]